MNARLDAMVGTDFSRAWRLVRCPVMPVLLQANAELAC